MNIIVCVKRVPLTQEVDLEIDPKKNEVRKDMLAYIINEWDNYAIEEAVRLKEKLEGHVTAITLGNEDDEEVLRRCLAMGADRAIRLDPGALPGRGAGESFKLRGYACQQTRETADGGRAEGLLAHAGVAGALEVHLQGLGCRQGQRDVPPA